MFRRWTSGIMIMLVGLWMLAGQVGAEANQASGRQARNEPLPAPQQPTVQQEPAGGQRNQANQPLSAPQTKLPTSNKMKIPMVLKYYLLLWRVVGKLILLEALNPSDASSQPKGVSVSGGGVELALDANMIVQAITVQGKPLPVEPALLVSLCDVSQGKFYAPAVCEPRPTEDKQATVWDLRFADLQATVRLAIRSETARLLLSCRVQSQQQQARGMLLRLAFPVDARGWQWHQDMQTALPIEADKRYENLVSLRAWADLPEWRDQPDLRMGYSNRHFLTVITGPVGLCLAVPVDWPCIFRTAYEGRQKRLEIVYDFALCPETATPNEAEFICELFACDPTWGFRDGLARYYRLYPEAFRNRIRNPGQWLAFSRLSEIDNADEFYFGLQEGASEPEYDDQLEVLSVSYLTHAGIGANIPDYDPEKDPLPPYEVQAAAVEAAFKRQTSLDGLFAQVGLHNAEGKLDVRPWKAYGHLIAQFNLDPHLPYARWLLERGLQRLQPPPRPEAITPPRWAGRKGLDGFYYDGLPTGLNYNPAHFKTAQAPCLWDPVHKKPFLNNFFSSWEFAQEMARRVRGLGGATMMNGALGASFYVAPWLDVLGSETGLHLPREQLNYIRSITYKKPFLTLLKGNYEQQIGRAEVEKYIKQCLAYGIPAGFFDWPTSGLGPGSRYWDHPRYYERDRDLFRLSMPIACTLARIGWEPVPFARCSEPKVYGERFGPGDDGLVWWTVMNEGTQTHKVTLRIEPSGLQIDPVAVRAADAISGKRIPLEQSEGNLLAQLEIAAADVRVLQLGKPGDLVRWRIGQAIETLDRGVRMRQLDRHKPARAVHWRPGGGGYERAKTDRGWQLLFTTNGRTACSASQWAMLFQQKPAPLLLRVQAAAQDLKGPSDQIGVRLRAAWVTPSFAHYETRFLQLAPGTYPERDFELRLELPQPLRAIEITPMIGPRVEGKLWLAKISLIDPATQREYVVDPEFTQWYEPIPEALQEPIERTCQEIRTELDQLFQRAEAHGAEFAKVVAAVKVRCDRLRQQIQDSHAENGCRRVLRDLETIQRHLSVAADLKRAW
ncbi:MAG: hypothetical protein NZ602_14830 [Thermoguttaceae bacterium]|nr:hypothetical protein [Thermoguttaceae bacterium]MDW8039043.1 hypothetical protein [Thermoguttaceae bacterium]